MADSVFEHVDDVIKLGGDNFGNNLAVQIGQGGNADTVRTTVAEDSIAAALGGNVSQIIEQRQAGGSVGDTETNDNSVIVVNIS